MSFLNKLEQISKIDINEYFEKLSVCDIEASLNKQKLNEYDFLNLLSDKAEAYLEQMAQKAYKISIHNFGRVIQLYIPLYISNYCTNRCIYCGFNQENSIKRLKLDFEEIENNAIEIAKTGMKHILFLTGEDKANTPLSYLIQTTEILKKYFSSISIEIYPMETEEYKALEQAGVDGLTIYQEVYDQTVYDEVHIAGKKKDYKYRIDAPERGAQAGFRSVNIGSLFGLAEPIKEAYLLGLHAKYLQDKYLDTEFSISLPRLNEAEGSFQAKYNLSDKKMVQFMLAFRLFLPRLGITISTRETAEFRDNLIGLGVTKMSAGSATTVGGYIEEKDSVPQFEISDNRNVNDIVHAIKSHGYQAVYKDWDIL